MPFCIRSESNENTEDTEKHHGGKRGKVKQPVTVLEGGKGRSNPKVKIKYTDSGRPTVEIEPTSDNEWKGNMFQLTAGLGRCMIT